MTVFPHSQTTNKLVNEAANDSARVSGQDRKIPPALGTNQIAGFGGFRPLTSLGKNKKIIFSYKSRVVIIFRFNIHLLFSLDLIVPRGSSQKSSIELAKISCYHIHCNSRQQVIRRVLKM